MESGVSIQCSKLVVNVHHCRGEAAHLITSVYWLLRNPNYANLGTFRLCIHSYHLYHTGN